MKNSSIIIVSLIIVTLTISLSSYAKYDKFNFKGEITISELKTENNITTLLVYIKNTSTKNHQIVVPKSLQDSFCLRLPWRLSIFQNNIEYDSQWFTLGYGPIGIFQKIKNNEVLTYKIDISWDYMMNNTHKKIIPDKDIFITLFYYPLPIDMNNKISSNTIVVVP